VRDVFVYPTQPTVGRIVHYTNLGDKDGRFPPEQQAAIITKVPARADGAAVVSLAILYPTGMFFMQDVPYSETYERGHWTWPPRSS
jgi:hypothetical protein